MRICYRYVQGLTRELLILPRASQAAFCYMQTLLQDDRVASSPWWNVELRIDTIDPAY
jgi:hypothetical protein